MSDEQKAMMAQAMASKAATGVSMMLPPRAAMVEYALTKEATRRHLPKSRRRSYSNSTRRRLSRSPARAST